MRLILVIIATLLLSANAQAQLRKCTGPDGKITYSDLLCSNNATTGTIKNPNGNSLDSSGLRRQAQQYREIEVSERAEAEIENGMQNTPLECKFAVISNKDTKGELLASNAKRECLLNLQAAKSGRAKTMENYVLWKDHYDQKKQNRQFEASQANAAFNAIQTRRAIESSAKKTQDAIENAARTPRSLTCTPNSSSRTLYCD